MAGPNWRAEMVRLLSSTNPTDWDTALALKLEQIPPSLFRYRKADCRSIDALAKQKLWFAQPRQFNDCYDTSVKVDMAADLSTVIRQGIRTMSTGLTLSDEVIARIESAAEPISVLSNAFAEAITPVHGSEAGEVMRGLLDKVIEHFGGEHSSFMRAGTYVACFTEDPTSKLMWGHYGDSHRGFCIEYGFDMMDRENLRYRLLFPVIYSADKFTLIVNGPPDATQFNPWVATLASIHKYPDWAYEREWRIVVPRGNAPAPAWDMGTPNSLILGHEIEPDERAKLMAIARDQHIPVTQIHMTGDFGLERQPVT
jgi:hypothetical protein